MQCTCTCVCMCMGAHVCEYMHTCGGPNLMFTTFFNASFILFFEMESLSQTLIYRACLAGQLVLGIPCLFILRLKLLNDSHMHPTFPWFLGIQTLPFLLVWWTTRYLSRLFHLVFWEILPLNWSSLFGYLRWPASPRELSVLAFPILGF